MPENLWAWLLAAASAIVLLTNAAKSIAEAVKAAKAPNAKQDKRMDDFEKRLDEMERELGREKRQLDEIHEGLRASYQAQLALLDHGIDGNNIKQMQDAKEALQQHLINR